MCRNSININLLINDGKTKFNMKLPSIYMPDIRYIAAFHLQRSFMKRSFPETIPSRAAIPYILSHQNACFSSQSDKSSRKRTSKINLTKLARRKEDNELINYSPEYGISTPSSGKTSISAELHPMNSFLDKDKDHEPKLMNIKRAWKSPVTQFDLYQASNLMGKFVHFQPSELKELLPEGFAGELSADLTLLPSNQSPLGIMFRKTTFEIISELIALKDEYDPITKKYRINTSGFLLDGHRGTGKSCILNFVTHWARKNKWLVIFEPEVSRYAREVSEIKRSKTGLYIQIEQSQKFLERLLAYNEPYLRNIPVNLSTFGHCSLDGTHRLYSQLVTKPLIKAAVQNELLNDPHHDALVKDIINQERKKLELWFDFTEQITFPSLRDRVIPQNLAEIAEYGLQHSAFAVQSTYEIFEQLKSQTTYPLLIIVDQWNECFPVSKYLSIMYEGTKYDGWIPSYHLTMPRLFYKWDGHQYARGLKIYSTCWKHMKRRRYRPELLGVSKNEILTVRNFTPQEFTNYVCNLVESSVLNNLPSEKLDYLYMLTGGNGFESRRLLTTFY